MLKVGLFGIGLAAYWPQFEGLRQRLEGYIDVVNGRMQRPGVEIVNLGLVDSPEAAQVAGGRFAQECVDVIFLYVTTYALSSTVLPVVQRAGVPVVVLNLQPVSAIDYERFNAMGDRSKMTGEWLAHCQACSVPEIANVFNRCGIRFHQITGTLHDDPQAWDEIDAWIDAARVAAVMRNNRMGLMGHYYGGMLDIYSDLTQQCAHFGGHMQPVEIDELAQLRRQVTDDQIERRMASIAAEFDVQSNCAPEELTRAAKTSLALDALVDKHKLGSLAYYYESVEGHEHEDIISSVIVGNSMLTARGIPVAGEYEVKNAQAMKIVSAFEAGGSFTEFYAMDFDDDIILMGHDGPGHIAIAQGKVKLRPLSIYHGKVGRGLSVEMTVKHGPVTLLSVIQSRDGAVKLLVAEGESVPGPILKIGNTNSRYRFPIGARRFMNEWCQWGPAHHCAVGVGHIGDKISKLGHILSMQTIRVA